MAKELTFSLSGMQYSAAPLKLDRKKIYGWSETIAQDRNGETCNTAYLSVDDSLIIPAGGIKQASISNDGQWVDKTKLISCDENGTPLTVYASSFDDVISLQCKATLEEFVDNSWESVYQLDNHDLAEIIGDNIFTFPFSYRGGVSQLNGFLINTPNGLFLFTGVSQSFSVLTYADQTSIDETEEDEEIDDLDFGMF